MKNAAAIAGTFVLLLTIAGCKKNDKPPVSNASPDLRMVADNLVSPIALDAPPDDSKRLFVVDQVGKVWIIRADGTRSSSPFMDISSKMVTLNGGYDERGLLGFTFHPDFKTNGKFYVFYSAPPHAGGPEPGSSWDNLVRVSEFKVTADGAQADMGSERVILEVNHPQSNHNGGTLAFGPDGYLYISIGDGGAANDVAPGHVADWYAANAGGNGQDIDSNLLGNILRIDVNAGAPYGIPGDNPFVNKGGRDEIYAFGFRNPYRFSFDMGGSHQLICGDAGQALWEEVSVVTKGGNYGWNVKEGRHCFNAADSIHVLPSCPSVDNMGNPLIDPVIELKNWLNPAGGRATTVIGGVVYRGRNLKGWDGKYIFGTFSQTPTTANGELFSATRIGNDWPYEEVSLKSHPDDIGYYLKGFGQDNDGEVYLAVSSLLGPQGNTGKVFKLVAVRGKNDMGNNSDSSGNNNGGGGY